MACTIVPASFAEHKNEKYNDNEFYVVKKNGYILLEFMQQTEDQKKPDHTTKKTFIMNMNNVRKFLDIDPDYLPIQGEEKDEEDICLNFTRQGQSTITNVKIKEVEGRVYEFTYFEIVN